ncbi:hypothetical protein DH2020_026694 [Rehmannia glutinosa]|uniref:Factor of DNA methylation 1-5/IDN2 domain-containing protein n=1 Tax=Rehmannia glutinosa TaxID=99300 RepID=A0ABR0VYL8_REHGL
MGSSSDEESDYSDLEINEEKNKLPLSFNEETRKLQQIARNHIKRVVDEQEMLKIELENEKRQLDSWRKELNKREALTERERQKLEEEKAKNDKRKSALQLASVEQRKADENFQRLVEKHEREKQTALKKILELERNLDEKHKLELETQVIKGTIEVMKHMGDDNDSGIWPKIDNMSEKWQEAHKNLITPRRSSVLGSQQKCLDSLLLWYGPYGRGLSNLLSCSIVNIGIKRTGAIDEKAFKNACELKFPVEGAPAEAVELCSVWQEKLKNPEWHPFRIVVDENGNAQILLNEDDGLLRGLKDKWGDEVYAAVITALKELQEYNLCGCYDVPLLWNFTENRKATLKEFDGKGAGMIRVRGGLPVNASDTISECSHYLTGCYERESSRTRKRWLNS